MARLRSIRRAFDGVAPVVDVGVGVVFVAIALGVDELVDVDVDVDVVDELVDVDVDVDVEVESNNDDERISCFRLRYSTAALGCAMPRMVLSTNAWCASRASSSDAGSSSMANPLASASVLSTWISFFLVCTTAP